jgi:hypothetical protein
MKKGHFELKRVNMFMQQHLFCTFFLVPKAYCKEDIDNRNTTWNFTEGGTVLNKTCPKGYEGAILKHIVVYKSTTLIFLCRLLQSSSDI